MARCHYASLAVPPKQIHTYNNTTDRHLSIFGRVTHRLAVQESYEKLQPQYLVATGAITQLPALIPLGQKPTLTYS